MRRIDGARIRAWARRGAVVLAAIAWASPLAAHASCATEALELPVVMKGTRAVATVEIDGKQVPLTVDSGAFFSMLTDAAAAQLALPVTRNYSLRVQGLTGEVETGRTRVDKLRLFKGTIDGVDFVVGGNEPGAGTMGLMGRNILSVGDTEYDLAHGAIRFHHPNDDCGKADMAYWAEGTRVVGIDLLRRGRSKLQPLRVEVDVNGQRIVALLDSGAHTVVTKRAAARAGIEDDDLKPAGQVRGLGRGTAKSWTATFDTIAIGGEVVRGSRVHVADFVLQDADMLLGIDFFLSHRLYVSTEQQKLFVTYNGGPVFALDRRDPARTASEAPGDATADELARRGAASAARRDYASALADLDRACDLEPTSAALFAQRADIQRALKRPAKALLDLDRALALDPSHADARFARATLRSAAKDRDGATADLDALDRTLAPQSSMRLPMAWSYLALDQPARAIGQLDRWLPAHPNEGGRETAFEARCWARTLIGTELAQALKDCDVAVEADATNATFLYARGWTRLRLGENAEALKDFDRSIAVRAANAPALQGRGLARMRLGDTVQGGADLAAARRLQPDIERRMPSLGETVQAAVPP